MEDLEFSILNAISKHHKLALDFAFSCDEKLFSNPQAKIVAKAILDYVKLYKSKPTRRVLLERYVTNKDFCAAIDAFYDKADEEEYLEEDFQYDVSQLKQKYGESRLEAIQERMNQGGLEDVSGTISALEREIGAIKAANGQKAYDRKVARDYIEEFRNLYIQKSKNPDLGKGILTGYSFLDYVKNGLRPADLIIIAGETGSGKSTFMNNLAIQIWMQQNTVETPKDSFKPGYNVAYFSLEMPYEDCFRRTMARLADVQEYGIRDAKLGRKEATGLSKACKFIKDYPYEFDIIDVPRGFSVEQLEIMFEEIKTGYVPDVIFLDYMGLMENISDDDDWLSLGKLAGKIHEFARVHSIPVVTAVQLNRIKPDQRSDTNKAVGLHRIGRSGNIADHATLIIQIESRQDEDTHDDFIYHIIKNRYGQSGKFHNIWKNFNKCSIIDKPYDAEAAESWSSSEDISGDISNILEIT
jgi:replicative DNA helicase